MVFCGCGCGCGRRTMKLVVYAHAFAPSVGGVETVVMALARGLSGVEAGGGRGTMEVSLATQTPRGNFDDASLPFRVVRRPSSWRLARLIHSADVVHLAGPALLPLLLSLLFRRHVVVEHHGYQAVCPNGLLLFEPAKTVCPGHFQARHYKQCWNCNRPSAGLVRSLAMLLRTFPRRWMCGRSTRNIAVSDHVRLRIQPLRSEVIYHGVPDAPLASNLGVESPLPGAPVCFAYAGRLVNEKGLPLLLQSASELNRRGYEFQLKFIGDGPERPRLETLTDSLNLRSHVTFTGFLTGQELEDALSGAHAIVMPSIWEETAGLAAIEHMMRGKLVIASDIGGLGEVVDGAGLKFPPNQAAALTMCLERALQSPSLVAEIGQRARERALKLFSQDMMVERHRKLCETLAAKIN